MIFGKRPPPVLANKPANLAEWLALATCDLIPSAQARIRTEIEAHYAETVDAHRQAGASPVDAETAALADLGDAPIAAERLCREHLTAQEAKAVRLRIKNARDFGFVFWSGMLSVTASILLSIIEIAAWAYEPTADAGAVYFAGALLAFVLIYASISIGADVQARRKPTAVTARQTILLGTIKYLSLDILSLTVVVSLMSSGNGSLSELTSADSLVQVGGWMIAIGALLSVISICMNDFHLRKKLAYIHEEDFTPHDPAV